MNNTVSSAHESQEINIRRRFKEPSTDDDSVGKGQCHQPTFSPQVEGEKHLLQIVLWPPPHRHDGEQTHSTAPLNTLFKKV